MHFLVFPRYEKEREFAGKTYLDLSFNQPITYTKEKEDEEIRRKMMELFSKHF